MKRLRLVVFLVILLIVSILLLALDEVTDSNDAATDGKSKIVVIKDSGDSSEYETNNQKYEFTKDEETMLLKIAEAEAGNQSEIGQALVIRVVLNRVEDDEFPDTISGVIFQKHQFSPIENGAYDRATYDDVTRKALQMVKDGWDGTDGATYFRSENTYDTWHYQNLEYLFAYDVHWFFKG